MAIVQPANDAFVRIVEEAADLLGYTDKVVKTIAVVPGDKETKPYIRQVVYDRRTGRFGGLKVGEQVFVEDGNIAKAIADLLDPDAHRDLIIANENLGGNTNRWILWNPIKQQPNLIGGKEL